MDEKGEVRLADALVVAALLGRLLVAVETPLVTIDGATPSSVLKKNRQRDKACQPFPAPPLFIFRRPRGGPTARTHLSLTSSTMSCWVSSRVMTREWVTEGSSPDREKSVVAWEEEYEYE